MLFWNTTPVHHSAQLLVEDLVVTAEEKLRQLLELPADWDRFCERRKIRGGGWVMQSPAGRFQMISDSSYIIMNNNEDFTTQMT